MLWIYLFSSLYLLVRLWWNILVTNLTTNFQDLVTKVKDLVALVPVLGAISCPDWPIRIKILKCVPLLSFFICFTGYRENNFPPLPKKCPCRPCFFQDISIDIPIDYQKTCRMVYIRWQGKCLSSMFNVYG